MKNRAHQESQKARLQRLSNNLPIEAIETLFNSIDNFFNNEIALTTINYQTSLLFLGIHASALTISEALFNKSGKDGFCLFLEKFIDGDSEDTKFSIIAEVIHDWRNVLAHQWLGSIGHKIEYDYKMEKGWEKRQNRLAINPKIYCDCYLKAFSNGGKIWKYERLLTSKDMELVKERIISKYMRR